MLSHLTSWFRPQPTFQAITDAWLADAERRCRPGYVREARRLLGRDLAPLAFKRASRVTRRDITEVLGAIPCAGVSNFAKAVVSASYNWAIASGLYDGPNPAQGLRKRPVPPRERVLSVPELALIWRASVGLGQFGQVARLLIATGLRRNEAGGLLWTEVTPDALCISGARMKGHRVHAVPLTALARECLPARRDGWPHVFGNRHDSGFSGWSKSKHQLDKALAGSLAPFRLHDIRRGVACGMAELGTRDEVIGRVLAHAPVGVTRRHYLHSARMEEQRAALEGWAVELRRQVTYP
jgi:integrase